MFAICKPPRHNAQYNLKFELPQTPKTLQVKYILFSKCKTVTAVFLAALITIKLESETTKNFTFY
jgi:hypothetical protein